MANKIKATAFIAWLILYGAPASAALTYNYAEHWLFDDESGLYWQGLQVPLSTFVPSHGELATYDQLIELGHHVGVDNLLLTPHYPLPGTYSRPLADLLSFFASNRPAPAQVFGRELELAGLFFDGDEFQYAYMLYRSIIDPLATTWLFRATVTLGPYGPSNPCPLLPTSECPATHLGFVVSTVKPVPLPAAAWLLLWGLGTLCVFNRTSSGPCPGRARRLPSHSR